MKDPHGKKLRSKRIRRCLPQTRLYSPTTLCEALEPRLLLTSVPSSPDDLVVTAASDTALCLTWNLVGTGATSINILRSTGGGAYSPLISLPAGSNIYTDTSCFADTAYSYEVTVSSSAGTSAPSSPESATTMASGADLAAGTNFTATAASPFAINLSWTDNVGDTDNWLLERSTNGILFSIIAVVPGTSSAGGTVTYTDTPLSPSTTYYYRVRDSDGNGDYSNYTSIVSATTQARPANTPLEATNLTATVNSATGTTLTWTDTNNGTASYLIYTAPYSSGTPTFTQVGQTAVGATSYNLTTTAETFYYVEIRASNSAGDSGYTPMIDVRSASPGTGSPKIYTIGPGEEYASLAALNWANLGPGDTVEIFPDIVDGVNTPYYEKPLISTRGTASAPITIEGMSVDGDLPIIDGTNAVDASQWAVGYLPLEQLSLVLISTRPNQTSAGWSPGYLNIENLVIQNAYSGAGGPSDPSNTFTASNGTTMDYTEACGIYIAEGDHITIQGCTVTGNNEGVFGAGQGVQRNLEEITLDGNDFYGNGTINSFLDHNVYLEGINTIYEYNQFGPLRSGSDGVDIKDRGAGTIIRYNSFTGTGTMIMLVQTQNYLSTVLPMPSYQTTYMYGNIFYFDQGQGGGAPIWYGGDEDSNPDNREGTLFFYNNTFVNQNDQSNEYYFTVFTLSDPADTLDARNNIIADFPDTAGTSLPLMDLLPPTGNAYFGVNWISPGYYVSSVAWDGGTETGNVAGLSNTINNAQNNPGFVGTPPAGANFQLTSSSQCLNEEGTLPANDPPVQDEYVSPNSGAPVSSVLDLGAYQLAPTFAQANGSTLDINLSSAGAVTLTASGGTITASQNGVQLSFTGITSVTVADSGSGDVLDFNGSITQPFTFVDTASSTINVESGTLTFAAGGSVSVGTLSIANGASAVISAATTDTRTILSLDSLAIGSTGLLDVTNNEVLINYGSGADPISSIGAWIASGYAAGAWNGYGIISSTARSNSRYGVGYADAASPGNPASLPSGQIKILYTLLGDATLSGTVNGTDLTIYSAHMNQSVIDGWDEGDFNYDGLVNGSDFILLAENFNQSAIIAAVAGTESAATQISTQLTDDATDPNAVFNNVLDMWPFYRNPNS
jgi:hypothetical protein